MYVIQLFAQNDSYYCTAGVTCFNLNESLYFPHGVFTKRFIWLSQSVAIISLRSVNRFVRIREVQGEPWGSHSGVAVESTCLMSRCIKLPTFRMIVVLPSSGSGSARREKRHNSCTGWLYERSFDFWLLDPEDDDTTILRNVRNYSRTRL
jgi:hypothetical protein